MRAGYWKLCPHISARSLAAVTHTVAERAPRDWRRLPRDHPSSASAGSGACTTIRGEGRPRAPLCMAPAVASPAAAAAAAAARWGVGGAAAATRRPPTPPPPCSCPPPPSHPFQLLCQSHGSHPPTHPPHPPPCPHPPRHRHRPRSSKRHAPSGGRARASQQPPPVRARARGRAFGCDYAQRSVSGTRLQMRNTPNPPSPLRHTPTRAHGREEGSATTTMGAAKT